MNFKEKIKPLDHEFSQADCLKGKIALVTGASQGLGRAIAIGLAGAGCRVAVNYSRGVEKAAEVVREIREAGGEAEAFEGDVSDETSVARLFAAVAERWGEADILINNARVDPYLRSPEMTEGEWWDRVMSVNLKGAFLCSWKFMERASAKTWGRIVNISSVNAFLPTAPGLIAYGVSKLGMHGLTRAFAQQGAARGITAATVAPGVIVTENIHRRLPGEKLERELARVPLGRGASMDEIVDAVLFVLRNGYVTGETIHINGGMHYAP